MFGDDTLGIAKMVKMLYIIRDEASDNNVYSIIEICLLYLAQFSIIYVKYIQ